MGTRVQAVDGRGGVRGRAVLAAALPLGLLASGALVWQASYASFTATTSTTGNSWRAGTVSLTDNDAGSAMFTVTGLVPGSTGSRCITVTYGGDVASTVRLYAAYADVTSDAVVDSDLAPYLQLDVVEGTASDASCSNWVAAAPGVQWSGRASALPTSATDYSTGVLGWSAAGSGALKTYKITYTLVDDGSVQGAQGKTLGLDLVWEARNA